MDWIGLEDSWKVGDVQGGLNDWIKTEPHLDTSMDFDPSDPDNALPIILSPLTCPEAFRPEAFVVLRPEAHRHRLKLLVNACITLRAVIRSSKDKLRASPLTAQKNLMEALGSTVEGLVALVKEDDASTVAALETISMFLEWQVSIYGDPERETFEAVQLLLRHGLLETLVYKLRTEKINKTDATKMDESIKDHCLRLLFTLCSLTDPPEEPDPMFPVSMNLVVIAMSYDKRKTQRCAVQALRSVVGRIQLRNKSNYCLNVLRQVGAVGSLQHLLESTDDDDTSRDSIDFILEQLRESGTVVPQPNPTSAEPPRNRRVPGQMLQKGTFKKLIKINI